MGWLPKRRGWSCSTNRSTDDEKAGGSPAAPGLSAAAGNALQRTGSLTMTNSTMAYNGKALQTVGVSGNLYHSLTIANQVWS